MTNAKIRRILGAVLIPAVLAGQALAAEGPTINGFVDFGYNYNFNGMPTNTLRGFDANSNSFTLQNAKVAVSGKTDKEIGYRVDVLYGFDASVTNAAAVKPGTGFFSAGSGGKLDLEQAYVSKPCPLTGGLFTFGKFVTLHGAEVIEAKDNFNISRGLLFNYAIPFTHTGLKYDMGFMENQLTTTLAIVNGWDNMTDNNKGKTVHGMVGYALSPRVSLNVGGTYGPEQTSPTVPGPLGVSTEKNGRSLVDTVLKVTPIDKLTLIANHDWGVEEGLAGSKPGETATWQGLALYGNYAFTEMQSLALRWETLDDDGMTRTGAAIGAAVADNRIAVNSYTATWQCKMDGLISRLEYRGDSATKKVFVDKDGKATSSQSTVGVQMIFPF